MKIGSLRFKSENARLTPEIAYESAHLPGNFHGDPADRMIVASARKLNAILVTFDQKILEYSNNDYVQVLKRVNEDS